MKYEVSAFFGAFGSLTFFLETAPFALLGLFAPVVSFAFFGRPAGAMLTVDALSFELCKYNIEKQTHKKQC